MSPTIYKSRAGEEAVLGWYDAQVASLPFAVEPVYVGTEAGRTHVLTAGPVGGQPVVLLHGMGMNAAAMGGAVRVLAGEYRVYAVDVVGMPGKSAGTRLARDGDGYPRWLAEVLDGLGTGPARFVGVSFGGWLVLKLAALAPARVRAAALLDTGGLVPFTLRGQAVAGLAALRYVLRPTPANGRRASGPFFGPGEAPEPPFTEILTLGYRHTRLDVDPGGLPVVGERDLLGFTGPAFVSYGEHDVFFPAERACARARAGLSGPVTCEVVPGQGHAPTAGAEGERYERVRAFFRERARAPGPPEGPGPATGEA